VASGLAPLIRRGFQLGRGTDARAYIRNLIKGVLRPALGKVDYSRWGPADP